MLTRRNFLKFLIGIGSAILLPPRIGIRRAESSNRHPFGDGPDTLLSTTSSLGESYAGFLLLPDRAITPSSVKYPKRGIPTFCGVGVGRGGPAPTAVSRSFRAVGEIASEVSFPLYTFSKLPENLRPADAHLIAHDTGEVFAVLADFEAYNKHSGNWETTVSIWAHPEFPRPFPLWSSEPVEPDGPAVVPEKVNFLPSPGVMVTTQQGAVFHWIRNDVLYTLIAELGLSRDDDVLSPSYDEALSLVSLLVLATNNN